MTHPVDFAATPLVPVVIQHDETLDVLMVGYMNQDAFEHTQETGLVHFWSRSRSSLWKKGETSGNTLDVVSIAVNCEDNSLLIQVIPKGAVCHTGHVTCFFRQVLPDGTLVETSDPVFDPNEVYPTAALAHRKENNEIPGTDDSNTVIALWFGGYEFLASEPLIEVSATSRWLHERRPTDERVADELDELAAVLAGEHAHSGDLRTDTLLEGSQVFYWLTVQAVQLELTWDADLELGKALAEEVNRPPVAQSIATLRDLAESWRFRSWDPRAEQGLPAIERVNRLKETYRQVSRAVSTVVGRSATLIEVDLEELRTKPYMSDYFASTRG